MPQIAITPPVLIGIALAALGLALFSYRLVRGRRIERHHEQVSTRLASIATRAAKLGFSRASYRGRLISLPELEQRIRHDERGATVVLDPAGGVWARSAFAAMPSRIAQLLTDTPHELERELAAAEADSERRNETDPADKEPPADS